MEDEDFTLKKEEIEKYLKEFYCKNREKSVLKVRNLESRTFDNYSCTWCNGFNFKCQRYEKSE